MHLSQAEIQKMKKNMRKVPVIQEKSEKYHEREDKEADQFINEQLAKTTNIEQAATNGKHLVHTKHNRFKKMFLRIQSTIKRLYILKQK